MPFLAQIISPQGQEFYVSAADREGLRYRVRTPDEGERFSSRALAEQAVREIKQIREVQDYRHAIVEA